MLWKAFCEMFERYRRTEKIRKDMQLTRKCGKELDLLLKSVGIDFSTFEMCPVLVEDDDDDD